MSDAYERVKGGRLTFKGGAIASRSKSIDKKKKKKKKKKKHKPSDDVAAEDFLADSVGGGDEGSAAAAEAGGEIYTIDAAKRLKYEELFPVEAKKFGYDPKSNSRSVEEVLDDRVKKKADRYCK